MGTQMNIFTYVWIVAFVTTKLLFFATCDRSGPHIGVNYGTTANNLPSPSEVINLIKKNGIKFVRIYEPNPDILNALRGSTDILISVGMKNEDIPNIAASPDAASAWVNTNIVPYKDNTTIVLVTVGNEVIPGPYAANVAQAMANIKNSINSVGLPRLKVSTTTAFNLQTSFPPSAGAFTPEMAQIMKDVGTVLRQNDSPPLVSFYPYFAYASNPQEISFEYATFTAQTPVVDGQFQYFSLLEAQYDAYNIAMAHVGAGDVPILIAETGWPTAGQEPYKSVANAQTYNQNFVNRIKTRKGPPRNPDYSLDVFIFSLFDENLKEAGIEQNWGIFAPNMQAKYPLSF